VSFFGDPGPECGTAADRILLSARWSLADEELRFDEFEPNDLFSRAVWGSKP
jgi:hypothetical protein